MKTLIARISRKVVPGFTLAAIASTATLYSQSAPSAPVAAVSAEQAAQQRLSDADLQELLGPIALYPDALVAIILPAAAAPSDIALAARYLKQNGDDADVSNQSWDASVRSLAKYPDVLRWMDENLEWTTSLGEAFVVQPTDVMNSVQELRLAAKDNGNLRNTPQQTVIVEQAQPTQTETVVREVVRIVPADPEVIYVPVYDPEVVYYEPYQPDYVTPLITFGVGFAVGAWLNYDCDWGNDNIYYGNGCGWNNRNRWNDRGWYDDNAGVNVTNVTNNNITNIVNNGQGDQWQPNNASRRYFDQRRNQNIGNSRIARANAQVRQPNKQQLRDKAQRNQLLADRPARVAKPQRAAAIRENTAANRPKNAKLAADNAPNAKAGKNNNDKPNGKANNKPNGNANNSVKRPKPSAAPNIAALDDSKKQNGKNNGGNGKPNSKQTADRPANKKPGAAPAVDGGAKVANDKPKKNDGKANGNQSQDRPANKKPSAAPVVNNGGNGGKSKKQQDRPTENASPKKPKSAPSADKPKVKKPAPQAEQARPQQVKQPQPQAQPKPRVQAQPQAEKPRPQKQSPPADFQPQPKPQKAQPKGNGGGGEKGNGGNGGGGNNGGKKKKDKDKD